MEWLRIIRASCCRFYTTIFNLGKPKCFRNRSWWWSSCMLSFINSPSKLEVDSFRHIKWDVESCESQYSKSLGWKCWSKLRSQLKFTKFPLKTQRFIAFHFYIFLWCFRTCRYAYFLPVSDQFKADDEWINQIICKCSKHRLRFGVWPIQKTEKF